MDLDLTSTAAGMALATWTLGAGYWVGERHARQELRRTHAAAAATEIVDALRELQRLVRHHDAGRPLEPTEVANAIRALGAADDKYGHRLPIGMGHVRKSVLDAVGTVFGAVAFAHHLHDTDDYPLEESHHRWASNADDYINYAARRVNEWGDSLSPRPFETHNDWLLSTGRRDSPRVSTIEVSAEQRADALRRAARNSRVKRMPQR